MSKKLVLACIVLPLLLIFPKTTPAADEVVYGPVDYTLDASGRYYTRYNYPGYEYIGCVSGNGDPRYYSQVPCLVKITNKTPNRFIYYGSIRINGRYYDLGRFLSPNGYYHPHYSYAFLRVCPPTYTYPYVNPIEVEVTGQPGTTLSVEIIKKDTTLDPEVTLAAEPAAVSADEPVTLTWSSTNADACFVSPAVGYVKPLGSLTVTLSETTTYTVTAYSYRSRATADTTVLVKVPVPPDVDFGRHPDEQMGGGGLVGDTVRITNGNVFETRTDLRLPSPHRLGLTFNVFYNSRSTSDGILGPGWTHTYSVSLDKSFEHAGQTYFKIVDSDGRGMYFNKYAIYDPVRETSVYTGRFNEHSILTYKDDTYIWHRLDGGSWGFDTDGRLEWIQDRAGNRLILTYDAAGNLEQVEDPASGRFLIFNINPEGRLASISGPITDAVSDGIWVRYGYDSAANPVSVTYADGSGVTYRYEDPDEIHNLTEKGNTVGHLINTWAYDGRDRCTYNFSAAGKGVSIHYNEDQTVEVLDAYGTLRLYSLTEIGGLLRVTAMDGIGGAPYRNFNVVRWQYDDDLNLSEIETAGGTVHRFMDFDAKGNPATVIEAAGSAAERITTFTYHPSMKVPLSRSIASVLGDGHKVTVWDYDNDGNETANENPTGLLSRVVERGFTRDGSGTIVPYEYITRFAYNPKGQVTVVDGPRTDVPDRTELSYNAFSGNLLTTRLPLVGVVSIESTDAAGLPLRVVDLNGQGRRFTYDGFGRLTGISFEADNSTTSIYYTMAGFPEVIVDEDGVERFFEYDDVYGRLLRILDIDGNTMRHEYDAQGNLISRSKLDATGAMTQIRQWDYQNPVMPGELWKEIQSDGSFREYRYDADGNVIGATDFEGHTTAYEYDRLNRPTAAIQPGGVRTEYVYDYHGNLRSVTDAEGHQSRFEYDDMGRLLSAISPDSGTTTYVYDAAGNVVQKTDGNGVGVHYTYDALNRLIHTGYPDATEDVTYTYDEGKYGKGRQTGIVDEVEQTAFVYDPRGRRIGKTTTTSAGTFALRRAYSPAGRLVSLTYPSGRRMDYNRYVNGKIEELYTTYNAAMLPLISGLDYNPFGPPKKMDIGYNGTVENKSGDCDCLEVINPGQPMEQRYTYDGNRNLISIDAPQRPWYNQVFTYDALGRLIRAVGLHGTIDYTYDNVGNRLTRSIDGITETYRYLEGSNRLAEIEGPDDTIFYEHDAAGNVIRAGEITYVYNQNNRLSEVQKTGKIYRQYGYNALGQRIFKALPPFTDDYIHFHYDFDGNIIAECDAQGSITAEYIYFAGTRMAKVDVETNTLYYYVNNYLGTPIAMTDATGTVVWEASHKPFGETLINQNSEVENNFRFPGQYFDKETSLHYNYHRYYDPKTGRYLRPDPIGFAGGINLYAYVRNNPINKIDPLGLQQTDMIANFRLLHQGYNPPPVDIPWSDYGSAILRNYQATINETIDLLFNDPCSMIYDDLQSVSQTDMSELGPTTLMGAGLSLVAVGYRLTTGGVGIFTIGGPVGWVGGGIVTTVGTTVTFFGVWTFTRGWQLNQNLNRR